MRKEPTPIQPIGMQVLSTENYLQVGGGVTSPTIGWSAPSSHNTMLLCESCGIQGPLCNSKASLVLQAVFHHMGPYGLKDLSASAVRTSKGKLKSMSSQAKSSISFCMLPEALSSLIYPLGMETKKRLGRC